MADNIVISLKVLEASTKDLGSGVARIDYDSMDSLSASTADVIEIIGKRRTVAKCLPHKPLDVFVLKYLVVQKVQRKLRL
jgi:transitional endoplasmic reticulum ATPase